MDMNLTALEKLTKARIQLQKSHPFWAYLSLGLNLIEKKAKDMGSMPTAGVDGHGNLFYCTDFIDKLNVNETKTVLAHEVSHVAYRHLLRVGTRNKVLWNIAADYTVNNILLQNGFTSIEHMLHDPKYSDKCTEEIYEDLLKNNPKLNLPRFDIHVYEGPGDPNDPNGKGKKGKLMSGDGKGIRLSPSQQKALEREWKRKIAEAYEHSRRAGNTPLGVDRLIDNLLKSKVSWRTLLNRFIISRIPFDWTYRKPSKISRVLKTVYLPSVEKESIDIIVGIDTSCSIQDRELALFKGDMLNIAQSFKQVNMHIITCDTQVHDDFELRNGTRSKFEKMKLRGGGGTDLRNIFKRVEKKGMNNSRNVLIMFTDGYTPFPSKQPPVNTIWVSTESPKENYPKWGHFVKVETTK